MMTDLGEIAISTYPYPVFDVVPDDGEENVGRYEVVSLYSDEPISTDSLTAATTINPPREFRWYESFAPVGVHEWWYFLSRQSGFFRVGTAYEVAISKTLRTELGTMLGKDLLLTFTTEPLRADVNIPVGSVSGGVPIRDFSISVHFNEIVEPDSVDQAISFEPHLDGEWIVDDHGDNTSWFRFMLLGASLEPDSDYRMTISDEVALFGNVRLPSPYTVEFHTEPYGVTNLSPADGRWRYPSPHLQIIVDFNTPADTASAEAAFTLEAIGLGPIPGAFSWHDQHMQFKFTPDTELPASQTYRVTLHRELRFANGEALGEDFVTQFRIR
jgi:hypothetical protein